MKICVKLQELRNVLEARGFNPNWRIRGAGVHTNDYCEERIARYLELAEAAQEAAGRASNVGLEETYAQLARQWVELARMAERTIVLAREVSKPVLAENRQQVS
jgi:hypothetical protein